MDAKVPSAQSNVSSEKDEIAQVEQTKLTVPLYNEHIDTSGVDERKLVRKLDWRLIPWLSLLYLLSFLDRTSIGNAKVGEINDLLNRSCASNITPAIQP